MNTTELSLPIQHGDLIIEAVGQEVRFWVAKTEDGKTKVYQIARCYSFMRQRVLQAGDGKVLRDAPDLTPTRVYNRKDRRAGAMVALAAGVEVTQSAIDRVHLFYHGRGPSGSQWGFPAPNDRYSFDSEP